MDSTVASVTQEGTEKIFSETDAFPFLRMPVELQHRVCALFCRHCLDGEATPAATMAQVAGLPFKTLKALSETCHDLNKIAQPFLYHYPDVKSYTLFFKTISSRPDLAASVRVLARLWESGRTSATIRSPRHDKEDLEYLKDLARRLHLDDADDPNFDQCFKYLNECPDGDVDGYSKSMAEAALESLITAIHFTLTPEVQFVMIDLDDGRAIIRDRLLEDGALVLPYPYLPKAVSTHPQHFRHLDTIVLRNTFHYSPDNLGLDRLYFLFEAIPNIRRVFFEFLIGEKPEGYIDRRSNHAELEWRALPHIQEVYFDPCLRPNDAAPLEGIASMLRLCTSLKKFTFRLKYPDEYQSACFSPSKLLEALLPTKNTLQHLELYCSLAKIPSFHKGTLLGCSLKEFSVLETLILDEELFCRHWLLDSSDDSCITDILPESVSFLTIRTHDKYKAVADLIRLAQRVVKGAFPRLSQLRVEVLHDIVIIEYHEGFNRNEDAFDAEYLLYHVPEEQWESTIRELAEHVGARVREAFQGTKVAVDVEFVLEPYPMSHWHYYNW